MTKQIETIDLGNNEMISHGVVVEENGMYTALTFTRSKTFKTQRGAERWLERNSPKPSK